MDTDWKALRAELPDDVRARLDAKRDERRPDSALTGVRNAMQASQQQVIARPGMTQNTVSKLERADDDKESRVDLTPEAN